MRRIINSTYVSLDGLTGHLERWHFEYIDDDATAFTSELLSKSDALLMGRRTYESFAKAWPPRSGEVADKINAMTKYVATSTLEKTKLAQLDGHRGRPRGGRREAQAGARPGHPHAPAPDLPRPS
jgi:dihydrofolate reductase